MGKLKVIGKLSLGNGCSVKLREKSVGGESDFSVVRECAGRKRKVYASEGPYDMALLDFADAVLEATSELTPSGGVRNQAKGARKAIRKYAGSGD